MKTFSNVANHCQLVPFPRSDPQRAKPRSEPPEPIANAVADRPVCPESDTRGTIGRFPNPHEIGKLFPAYTLNAER